MVTWKPTQRIVRIAGILLLFTAICLSFYIHLPTLSDCYLNAGALPNSGYKLHVIAQYDFESILTTQIFTDEISVVQAKPDRWNKQFIGGIVFICFLFLLTSWIEPRESAEFV
jgi:hypothetical protein